jgi:hypothetical protein
MLFETYLLRQFIDKFDEEEDAIRLRIVVCDQCNCA